MTEAEILEWVAPGAVLAPGTRLRRTLVDGMAGVPVPERGDSASQLAAFRAFLACAGPPGPGRLVEPVPYRILVTGSRGWADEAKLRHELGEAAYPHPSAVIVHGACPRGADAMAAKWAADYGVTTEPHPARWRVPGERYNPGAGFERNQAMADAGAGICLAFIRRGSPGATDCARRAESAGIPVRRFTRE